MALPVEIGEFMSQIAGFWLCLPLMVRQLFYLCLFVTIVFAIIKFYRGGSDA